MREGKNRWKKERNEEDKKKNNLWSLWRIFKYICYISMILSLCLSNHYRIKREWGSGCIAPRILNLGTRYGWLTSCPDSFVLGEGAPDTYWIGGSDALSVRLDGFEEEQFLPGVERRFLGRPFVYSFQLWLKSNSCKKYTRFCSHLKHNWSKINVHLLCQNENCFEENLRRDMKTFMPQVHFFSPL
jgi:hypothetical protein